MSSLLPCGRARPSSVPLVLTFLVVLLAAGAVAPVLGAQPVQADPVRAEHARAAQARAQPRPAPHGPAIGAEAQIAPAVGSGPLVYQPPVRPPWGVVVGHFRPPPTPYGAGDRGVDYATVPGQGVVAAADGVVVFAGPVAGVLAVTIAHPDGLRTSYTYVASIEVRVGQAVRGGQPIATTSAFLHVGVRDPDGHYLDPEPLFAGHTGPRLVPGADDGVAALGSASGVGADLGPLLQMVEDGARSLAQLPLAVAQEALSLDPVVSSAALAEEIHTWWRSQQGCTPPSVEPPPPSGRRIAVLVAGLGSNDRNASIDDVDTTSLGYAPGDVVRFSYRGGRAHGRQVPPGSMADSLPASTYTADDTEVDLRSVADRLVALLAQVAARAPGVPIDVMAHSEGGVVVHLALIQGAAHGALPAQLGLVTTISSPHQGAPLATAFVGIDDQPVGRLGLQALYQVAPLVHRIDENPDGVSLGQLSETSSVTQEMRQPLPPGVRMLAIGASGDPVVPAVRASTPGATTAIVSLQGLGSHGQVPGDPAVTREIALARAGLGPTCTGWAGLVGVVESHGIVTLEEAAGLGLATATAPGDVVLPPVGGRGG